MKKIKTNAMRFLEEAKIPHTPLAFPLKPDPTPASIARDIQRPLHTIYKTLVAEGSSQSTHVFVIPLEDALDLKKAAMAAGEKSLHLLDLDRLLPVTGYVRGGVSPFAMKKALPTYLEESALSLPRIVVSAGKRGHQLEVSPRDLLLATGGRAADLLQETRSIF